MIRRPALISALVLCASVSSAADFAELDRQRLAAHLEMTAGWLISEVSDLSQAQLTFRRAPESWSVLEVVEHLVVVGPIYWSDLQRAVRTPASEQSLMSRDADILWYGIDRTHRETALASESPKGELRNLRAGLDAYREQHAQLLRYVRTTKDDLRRHVVERQGCDAYQWALLISTHVQRHILQIREIKADPKFPRT
jgi:hypothetical protein